MRLGPLPIVVVALIFSFAPALPQTASQPGAIRGSAHDKDFDAPLARVRVTLVEELLATATDADGRFLFERVPPGTYTLSFTKDGYERTVVSGVVVAPGQVAEVRAEMTSEVVDMEEMVVKGEDLLAGSELGLLEIRAEATVVQDAISSDLIGQAGASDAAGALKLVVGATVTDGKYATVRGLSDRYTGTTLNGVRLPSADPRKRAVNIDIFPTGTIESMTVTKTFTPDLQGDFTGGGVDIKTKSVPDETMLSVSLGTEHNTSATGNDAFLTYDGGGINPSGFDDGDRNLPAVAHEALPRFPRFSANPPPEEIAASQAYDELTRAFEPVIGTSRDAPGPNRTLTVLYGDKKTFAKGGTLGWMTALSYANKYFFYEDGVNNTAYVSVAGQPMTLAKARADSQGVEELLIGLLGSVTFRPSDTDELTLRIVGNQSVDDEARFQSEDQGSSLIEQNQTLRYTERSLGSAQLLGKHTFSKIAFDWLAAFNTTRQEEPDVRFFRNLFDQSNQVATRPANSTDAQNTRRIFRSIDERNGQGAANLSVPFASWTKTDGTAKGGLYYESSHRDYTQDSFTYTFPRQAGPASNPDVRENNALASYHAPTPDALWTDVFLDANRIGLASNTPPAPNQLLWTLLPLGSDVDYTGDQTIEAAYAMAELPVTTSLELVGGARWESTSIGVVPVNRAFGRVEIIIQDPVSGAYGIAQVPQALAVADIDEGDLLPSIGAIWEIRPEMRLRASWAKTIARPTFRELAPVATEEFIFGDEFVGNPHLTLSSIENWDLRWEWFRRPGDVLAASVFAKSLRDPIEYINFSAANRTFVQPINYEKGRLRGIELEARAKLDVLHEALGSFTAGGNLTWLDSSVDVPADQQDFLAAFNLDEPTRPLQGQPEAVFNANLTYDDERLGISAGIFYNVVGRTLISGAATGLDGATPNVYQEPFQTLDATFEKTFKHGIRLLLKGKNLLAPEALAIYRTPYADEEIKTLRRTARLFGLTLGWSY
ncbi:MAG TPA: TonB-dependent receptor [Candidatus Polarisedimenticolaceae bacterium]|nr:TonB-dependent receptor [Candidatus Polarisedimenticolaceae bacterium]